MFLLNNETLVVDSNICFVIRKKMSKIITEEMLLCMFFEIVRNDTKLTENAG